MNLSRKEKKRKKVSTLFLNRRQKQNGTLQSSLLQAAVHFTDGLVDLLKNTAGTGCAARDNMPVLVTDNASSLYAKSVAIMGTRTHTSQGRKHRKDPGKRRNSQKRKP